MKLWTIAVMAAATFAAWPSLAQPQAPLTVVELFTSQGCNSCPPANANLIEIKDRPGILALSFNVTYWDYLGWKDSFGKEEFTDRQRVYEGPLGNSGPFTPQIIVNGNSDTVGNRLSDIEALLSKSADAGPMLEIAGKTIRIGAGNSSTSADVWAVQYHSGVIDVAVSRGENGGRTLPHANVVRSLTRIGKWTGNPIELALPEVSADLRTAVLIQAPAGGPILSAITN